MKVEKSADEHLAAIQRVFFGNTVDPEKSCTSKENFEARIQTIEKLGSVVPGKSLENYYRHFEGVLKRKLTR